MRARARDDAAALPRPPRRRRWLPAADLAELVRLYGLRMWVEQGYKQVKHELGWADFQVRSDRAIRRHWQLVCCAFSFCWRAWFAQHPGQAHPHHAAQAAVATAAPPGGTGADRDHHQASITGSCRPAPPVLWPTTLRRVRSWLAPWIVLWCYWRAWSPPPPPPQLQALLDWAAAGRPLHLYLPP